MHHTIRDKSTYDFCGLVAFTEPEAAAVKRCFDNFATLYRIQTYFSLHSFSQLYIFPYTPDKVKNYEQEYARGDLWDGKFDWDDLSELRQQYGLYLWDLWHPHRSADGGTSTWILQEDRWDLQCLMNDLYLWNDCEREMSGKNGKNSKLNFISR